MYCPSHPIPVIPKPVSGSSVELSVTVFSTTGILPFTRNSVCRALNPTKPQVLSSLSCVNDLMYPFRLMDRSGREEDHGSQTSPSLLSVHALFSALELLSSSTVMYPPSFLVFLGVIVPMQKV